MCCGAFAIRTCDVYGFEFVVWIAEGFAKGGDVAKVFFHGCRAYALVHGQLGVEVVKSKFKCQVQVQLNHKSGGFIDFEK